MSSISKAPTNSTEESGWTTYFDDFFNNNNKNDDDDDNNSNNNPLKCSSVSLSTSSSLLSDATSFVDKNLLSHNQHVEIERDFSLNKNGSSFKKRKNIVDQALEDTAISPLNSQKEKGNTSGQKELSLNGKDSDCTELKKIDVCVVPL